jgi:hypothetical protein
MLGVLATPEIVETVVEAEAAAVRSNGVKTLATGRHTSFELKMVLTAALAVAVAVVRVMLEVPGLLALLEMQGLLQLV